MSELNRIPLTALRAIEAVGKFGNLRLAAESLAVTPGAVSQQIVKAEALLGQKLFDRQKSGLKLTPVGVEVYGHLSDAFVSLERAIKCARPQSDDAITVSVAPVLAGKWLVWRIGRFSDAHPGMRIKIDATTRLIDPVPGDVDACIRAGWGDWPNVAAEKLLAHRVFPVCAPDLAKRLKEPEDLRSVPIIREPNTMFSWNVWLKPNGMHEDQLGTGPVFSDASLCLDAAVAGQGVFLAWETLAHDALESGRLVAPFPGRFKTGIFYWFVEPKAYPRSQRIQAFRDWLVAEMSRCQLTS